MNRTVVINPNSRRGKEWGPHIKFECEILGVPFYEAESAEDLIAKVSAAIESGADEVWVGGGDGTIGEVFGCFVGKKTALGILPLGTGNALANELGIPCDPDEIIPFLTEATPQPIDAGKVNDRHFCTVATLGLTTTIAETLSQQDKTKLGRFLYLPAALRSLFKPTVATCKLQSGGRRLYRGKITQLVIANTRTHAGPFTVSEAASVSDGKLSVYWLKDSTKRAILRYVLWMVRTRNPQVPEIDTVELQRLVLSSRRKLTIVVDGDLITGKRFEFESLPSSVRVLCAPTG